MKKILLIVNTDGALYVFRKPIIDAIISLGHIVTTISAESNYFNVLKKTGVNPISLDFSRHSASPIQNFILFTKLYKLIKYQHPDIVHNFTHKPAIYGTIAAKLAGVKGIFITITGLGTVFVREDIKSKLIRYLLLIQYKFALQFSTKVYFQNPDDMEYFINRKIVSSKKAILTYGSGIDLNEYPQPSLNDIEKAKSILSKELQIDILKKTLILFPSRGVPEKGFIEFYKAAKLINQLFPNNYIFLHLGLIDLASSRQISKDGIDKLTHECGVHYLGFKEDIKNYMLAADIVTLPSYREGTPRSLIEALALGKVVITTDVPGCRETVLDGWNGFLCKVGDAISLATKLLAVDENLIIQSRTRSRNYCEIKYDAKWLVTLTINNYMASTNE